MEQLKKINYEAGITTHNDVREALNALADLQNLNNSELSTATSAAKNTADTAKSTATTAKNTADTAKSTADAAKSTADDTARTQVLTPSGTIPFDSVHDDGITLESIDYDLNPVDLDTDNVLGVSIELYPSATASEKLRSKGVFVATLTLKGTPSSRKALNWKASAKHGVQDSRQYNNATRTGDATGYITDDNFAGNGGVTHGNMFWCRADKKVYQYTTETTNNYGVFVYPDATQAASDAAEAKKTAEATADAAWRYAMSLHFDEEVSSVSLDSENSMGYTVGEPDAQGVTALKIVLAQSVSYNGGSRVKGTFLAQITTASGTKYAMNWMPSARFGVMDSRYYNNAGANPYNAGTAADPTKYITDDVTFKSTDFRGIRAENIFLCRKNGAIYMRDTTKTEWYSAVNNPTMWVE